MHESFSLHNISKLPSHLRSRASAAASGSSADLISLLHLFPKVADPNRKLLIPLLFLHLDPARIPKPKELDSIRCNVTRYPELSRVAGGIAALDAVSHLIDVQVLQHPVSKYTPHSALLPLLGVYEGMGSPYFSQYWRYALNSHPSSFSQRSAPVHPRHSPQNSHPSSFSHDPHPCTPLQPAVNRPGPPSALSADFPTLPLSATNRIRAPRSNPPSTDLVRPRQHPFFGRARQYPKTLTLLPRPSFQTSKQHIN
ncbi:hypothetical protein C8R46DRAFT_1047153 [Mycena filopes]|nr:hypothetical protein C8R46DRAFT_1047153 [Mycena filopes]